jgi:Cu/Ag efflux pump CusA
LPAVARQQVVQPSLAPLSTAIGEIFRYVLEGLGMDESEVRALQDWVLRPASLTSSALAARSRNIKCRSIRSP